jgi:hypothetical protein
MTEAYCEEIGVNEDSAKKRARRFSKLHLSEPWEVQSPKKRGENHIHVPEVKDHH